MARRGLHRLIRHRGPRRKAVVLGVLGTTVVLGLAATMVPLLAADDLSIPVVADTTATMVSQDGDNGVKATLATCPAGCDGNPRGAREAILEFSVTSLPANAVGVRAVLRVHAWQAFDATVTAHASRLDARAARPAPAPVGAALDVVAGVGRGFNEWDVSGLISGNGIWTVSLAQSGLATRIYWASAENRNPDLRPRLVVSYGVGARPTTAAPSAAPGPSVTPTRAPVPPSPSPSASPSGRPTPANPSSTPTPPAADAGRCGTVSDKLVPSCGAWWGMYSPTNPATWDHGRAITDIEAQVGRAFDVVHRYHDFSNTGSNGAFPDVYQQQQMREGRLMFFAWETRIFSSGAVLTWKDVYGGGHDATIDAVAGRIRAVGQPVFLGFDHEPEDEPAKGSDADFVRAWRYVHDRFAAAGVRNAVWVWTMMGWSGHYDRYAGLYPGDRYVDWVAWDPYNFHVCNGGTVWRSPSATVGSFYRWLDEQGIGAGKPRMLAEFGTNFDSADPTAKQRWFEEFP
ncbi:glycosyl hydrolase, partial [Micromonospora sp. NPDC051296]|uniref:glycosyl hydrolase n=1 Tax=Micromonospora sp. NPDC051296 TaxID=3155046 RepID=UPI00341263A3